MSTTKCLWVFLAVWSLVAVAHTDPRPTFSRVLLTDTPTGGQPSVALEPDRGFIVTWQSTQQEVTSLNWLALNFDGEQTGRGVIAQGPNWFVNWADTPALAVLDNGDWVAFWLERNDPTMLEGYDIRVVRSTDRGATWSTPISPHRDGTKTQHGFVSMIAAGDDRLLMAWLDGRRAAATASHTSDDSTHDHESAPMTLRSAVLNRASQISEEFEIDEKTCSCCQTDMARWAGQALIVYRDRTDDEVRDISVAQRTLARWESPKAIHNDGWKIEGCPVNGPAIAVSGRKGLVFWPTFVNDQMILRYVVAESPEALANGPRMKELQLPAIPSGRVDTTAWHDGFLLTWISRARDRPAVEVAIVDANGQIELGVPIAEPALRGRSTGFPRIVSDGGRGLVVWPELGTDGIPVIGAALFR
ncbi:MAG: sialidase family protein [Proteobacteria bacterium]|nr:sialidase family protein [Pseudomonadota bacterium]